MPSDLPVALLGPVVVVVLILAFRGPVYGLLFADIVAVIFPGKWELGGVLFDITDVIFAGVVLYFAMHAGAWREARRKVIPQLYLWAILGCLFSLAYLDAPMNQEHLTSPVATAYQLYRYAWRSILYYPLCVFILSDRQKVDRALLAIVLAAGICSIWTLPQGYSGLQGRGPLNSKNVLAGSLIVPFLLCSSNLLFAESRRRRWFYLISLALMGRALLFAGSRGTFVALFGAMVFLVSWILVSGRGRSKMVKYAGACLLLLPLAFSIKPDLLERPNVQRMFTASGGMEEDTMRWRLEERWPHFLRRILAHPWLGTGSNVDRSLGGAPTPHNGYLGRAVHSGVPSLCLFLVFLVLAIRNGILLYRRGRNPWQKSLGIAVAAGVVGLSIHNIVDETFTADFTGKTFWIVASVTAMVAARPKAFLAHSEKAVRQATRDRSPRQTEVAPAASL